MSSPIPRSRPFAQVDVFTATPYRGNPVAVVLDGAGIDDDAMAAFARWTNLSETTFVVPPTSPGADYRLRIFTPGGEIPFAGHPTLGSAHAWLENGGVPADPAVVVQECALGLVPVHRGDGRLAFTAPAPLRTGPVEPDTLARLAKGLGLAESSIVDHQWVDNGPGWAALLLGAATEVVSLEPDFPLLAGLMVGVVAPEPPGADVDVQVRAFAPAVGVPEDPVTGSLNAGIAQWLIGSGRAPASYVAGQGSRLGRAGRVFVDTVGDEIRVGGRSVTCIRGAVEL